MWLCIFVCYNILRKAGGTMNKLSKGAKNKRPQATILGGLSIYHDEKNRTIYYNRISKRAYVIKPNDFGTFQTYNMRFFAALAATIVLFSFSDTFLANPLIAIGIGVLVFVVLQVKFNSFLKRCTVIANFDPKNSYGSIQIAATSETRHLALKALLFLVLAVLIIYNAYERHYGTLTLIITWLLAVYAGFQIVLLLMALNYKRQHPDLDLDFIKENRPKDKKARTRK